MKMICISQKSGLDQESENTMCSWCCGLGFKKIWIIITRSLRGRLTTKCTWIYISETGLGSLPFTLPQRVFPSAAEKLTTAAVHLSSIFCLSEKKKRERKKWRRGRKRALVFPLGLNLFSNIKGQTSPQKLEMKTIFK